VAKILKDEAVPALIVLLILSAVAAVLGAYLSEFSLKPLGSKSEWGAFGDYVGGTLNPLFGLITMLVVALTYRLQQTQLTLTKDALESQSKAAKEAAELNALTAALDALNIMIATKASTTERSTVGRLLAVSRREAIIERIIMIAHIEVESGRDIKYPDYEEKDELN